MSNILNDKLALAARITHLRSELAAAEAAFLDTPVAQPATRKVRGPSVVGPSISQRVLNLITDSGENGIPRSDILAVIGVVHESAIHSALREHSKKLRIVTDGDRWRRNAKSPG